MEELHFKHTAVKRADGTSAMAIVGVVASGNLEVLAERVLPGAECSVDVKTAAAGFGAVWGAVVADFVQRYAPGGIQFSINDGGARPDTVSLRLAQAARVMESGQ